MLRLVVVMMYICVRHVVFVRPFFCEQELARELARELGSELASELAIEAILGYFTPSTSSFLHIVVDMTCYIQ